MAQGEWNETTERITAAVEILDAENPMTIRQLFYRLVSKGLITNCQKHYSRVSRDMTKARMDGRAKWDWIVDRTRPVYSSSVWENPADFLDTAKNAYRLDYWQDQSEYVEIWLEKDSVSGSLQALTREYGVTMRAMRGFNSATRMHEIGCHLRSIRKPAFVYYLGDHDPSGTAMDMDLQNRIDADYKFKRLAIFKADIRKFKLPPLRIKRDDDNIPTDSRSEKYLAKHGDVCVELDALPPDELRRRVREAIEDHMDHDKWDRAVMIEMAQRESIMDVVSKMVIS